MSRLDSFIRRLEAQRACLDHAARLVAGLDGAVLELGLGNGRTYDHLRELFPGRDIYVCEKKVAAHPDCVPPPERLILGDMRETLPAAHARLGGRVALVAPLLCAGGILVSDPPFGQDELEPLPLPDGVPLGRYHLYRRV